MRHLIAGPAILLSLSMGVSGCSSTSTTQLAANTTTLLDEVTTITAATCKFIPTAETVAGLATAASASATAALTLASAIAGTICGAVTTNVKSTRRSAIVGGPITLPSAYGVTITGSFIDGYYAR